jgi:hypothetical protein
MACIVRDVEEVEAFQTWRCIQDRARKFLFQLDELVVLILKITAHKWHAKERHWQPDVVN